MTRDELFEQFERQAIDANYPINFTKTDGNTKYFYTQTQAVFNGWLLHYRHSNGVAYNVISPTTWLEKVKQMLG